MNDPESHMALPHPFIQTAPWNPVALQKQAEQHSPEATKHITDAQYKTLATLGGVAANITASVWIEAGPDASGVTGTILDAVPWVMGALNLVCVTSTASSYFKARQHLNRAYQG